MDITKTCNTCRETFTLDKFQSKPSGKYAAKCRSCCLEARKPNRPSTCLHCGLCKPPGDLQSTNVCKACYLELCKAKYVPRPRQPKSVSNKEHRKEYAKTERCKDVARNSRFKKKYNITLIEYKKMVVEQGGLCAICRQPERRVVNGTKSDLAVDHDHVTGEVRGLLCFTCNTALGKFGDSSDLLRKALEYLGQKNR